MSDAFYAPNDGAPIGGDTPQGSYAAENPDSEERIDPLKDPQAMMPRFVDMWKAARDHWHDWRQEAHADYDFVAGHQWSEEDAEILRSQMRLPITFNRIGPFIDGVSGLEIGNRQEIAYIPRQIGSQGKSDILTAAAEFVRDECDAEDEESIAFRDATICGQGDTQTRMDYDADPDGMIVVDRVNPLEMYWDPAARKQNYADARYVMRVKDIPLDAAQSMFPDEPEVNLHAQWAEDTGGDAQSPHNARLAPYYRIDQSGQIDRYRQMVRLVEVEWIEYESAFRVLDPTTGRMVRLDAKRAAVFRLLNRDAKVIPDRERVVYKAIVGAVVLSLVKGADRGGFSYKAITGKIDNNSGLPYGLVRAMRDPQMWANKWLSQALHIVNTNAKGGLLAENDAFVDVDEARDSWAEADSFTLLNPGGLAKVQQKNPPAFPAQINELMQFAIASIPQVSGISPEMMAMADRNQPGVLEMQRKQQGMTILADLFNAKRRYHKEQGRLLLWMIQTFISDGRLIRIGGPENVQYVPLVRDQAVGEYDVIVDEAPASPNMKERVWAALGQLFPVFGRFLTPQIFAAMLKYSPFPASFQAEMEKILSAPPPPNPGMQGKAQLDQATAQLRQAQAQKMMVDAQATPARMALEAQETRASIDLKTAQATNQLQNAGLSTHEAAQATVNAAHDRAIDVLNHMHQAGQSAVNQAQPSPPQPGSAPVDLPG